MSGATRRRRYLLAEGLFTGAVILAAAFIGLPAWVVLIGGCAAGFAAGLAGSYLEDRAQRPASQAAANSLTPAGAGAAIFSVGLASSVAFLIWRAPLPLLIIALGLQLLGALMYGYAGRANPPGD